MMPTICDQQAPVPPPSYRRRGAQTQAQRAWALHIDALSLIETLHLLALCRPAVRPRCPKEQAVAHAPTAKSRWC